MRERLGVPAATRGLPEWARWNAAAAERPWSVGIEEEAVLLDPLDWAPANCVDEVLACLPPDVAARASAETHACVVELKSAPHATVAAAVDELERLRGALVGVLGEELGLGAAAAGTHPLADGRDVAVSRAARYQQIRASTRALVHREPTMALHVHVAVPDPHTAARALDGIRGDLPLLLALSANSPFWRGADSGFASIRTPIFSMFPRVGIPRRFGGYRAYVRAIAPLLRSGAVPDLGYLWWDARLRPEMGTVEVRIMDAQSCTADVAALAALVHALVRLHAGTRRAASAALGDEALAENRFLAARDGVEAQLIGGRSVRRASIAERLAERVDACAPYADALGCAAELEATTALLDSPGSDRQRRLAARDGLAALPARLAEQFSPGRPVPQAVAAPDAARAVPSSASDDAEGVDAAYGRGRRSIRTERSHR